MKAQVIDAGVVAAAFFQEKHAAPAQALLTSGQELCAPDLIIAELGNVVWKRCARGEIDKAEAADLLRDVLQLPLNLTPSKELAPEALELAIRTGCTVYDCLYLALAVKTQSVMLTTDRRLVRSLAETPLAESIVCLGGQT